LTTLTFYGGVNEVGGNKVLFKDRDTRIFPKTLDKSKPQILYLVA